MTYEQQIRMIVTFLYNETKCFATSSTYHIPYEKIKNAYGMWVGTKNIQDDIREEFGNNHLDRIQALDFDDIKQEVVVMIWESNNKKKYTLKEWKEFCKDALVMPPFEDDEQLEEWFDTHKIHITANNCVMELEYDADAVNEIEFALQEIHEAIHGDGTPTTGNTVGSEYPNATWKDILRFAVLDGYYEDSHTMEAEVEKCIHRFTRERFEEIMKKINEQTSMNDELEVNFFKLESKDLYKIFDKEERRQAFKEILCSKIEVSEMVNEKGEHDDIVVIMDYSIKPSGDLVGWHYGVDFDKNSEDNQDCIKDYIGWMTK